MRFSGFAMHWFRNQVCAWWLSLPCAPQVTLFMCFREKRSRKRQGWEAAHTASAQRTETRAIKNKGECWALNPGLGGFSTAAVAGMGVK